MNYRHHFHAGNFADVVKHVLLLGLLEALARKDTPFCYLDTHAGSGLYDLGASAAQRTLEFKTGLGRLKAADPAGAPRWVADYQKAVAALQAERQGFWYPGSPWLALQRLRAQDRAVLLELHPDEAQALKQLFAREPRVAVHRRDAYEGLPALVPPREKRGLVLIDPPYEQERDDFAPVAALLQKAHAKWPGGLYALWFPIKDQRTVERFYRRLRATGIPKLLTTELNVLPPDNVLGLNGSGLVIVNPPWQFEAEAAHVLRWLQGVLSAHPQASHRVAWLSPEAG